MELQSTELADKDFLEFARGIQKKTGLDLLQYKQAQVRRRLTSLKERKGYRTFRDFFQDINTKPDVYQEFMDQLTINVTEFYRNNERWRVLSETVLPDLLSRTQSLKCWSAACSTGEEPYSLVMLMAGLISLPNIVVHATDLDQAVLERAKRGSYPASAVQGVPADRLKRWFTAQGTQYVISDEIKRRVQFRQHNLLLDRFEGGYDLIVCRNVLIYFTEEAKTEIYRKFAAALKPGGYLFVGSTEQVFNPEQYGLSSPATFFYKRT